MEHGVGNRMNLPFLWQRVHGGLIRVEFATTDIMYTPEVPNWKDEVAGNYYDPAIADGYRFLTHCHLGDLVIDVGANLGGFSLLAYKHGYQVLAFEPMPENARCLREMRKTFRPHSFYHDFRIQEAAVSDYCGEGKMVSSFATNSGSSILNGELPPRGEWTSTPELTVPVVTIDSLCSREIVGFIKCDSEGSEEKVLRGAADTLRRCYPYLAFSAYHKPEDTHHLEAVIRELAPAYNNFELGRPTEDAELRLYAWRS